MASNDVLVRLVADVSNLQKGMDKAQKELMKINNTTSKLSSSMQNSFKRVGLAVAGAFAVDKLVGFTKGMIEATASVNALDSMFEQTFKGDQAQAMERITEQAKEQNINVDRLKGSWASFYGTFRGNGASANESLDLTSRYMKLAGDSSAYYDKSLEDVVGRLKSITMGNFEAGDAIGINVNATKLGKIANEQYGKSWQDLTDTEKEYLILDTAEQIYENNGAMGQASREAENWSNVLGNLKATWERFLSVIGQPALQIATGIVTDLTGALETATAWVGQFADMFRDCYSATGEFSTALASTFDSMNMSWAGDMVMAFQGIIDIIKDTINWFKEHELATDILIGVIGGLVFAYAGLKTAMAISNGISSMNKSLTLAQQSMALFTTKLNGASLSMVLASIKAGIWNTVSTIGATCTTAFGTAMAILTSPITLVIGAIVGLIAVGYLLIKHWDTVKAFLTTCWNTISSVAQAIWNGVCEYFSTVMAIVSEIFTAVWSAISGFVSSIMNTIWQGIMFVWNGISTFISTIMTAIFTVISTMWNSIYTVIKPILELIRAVITTVWQGIQLVLAVILSSILGIVKVAWEGIKACIEVVLKVIHTIVSTVWGAIKTAITTVLGAILGAVKFYFNAHITIIKTVLGVIQAVVTTVWGAIKSVITTILGAIKGVVSSIWNGIKSVISNVVNGIKSVVISGFNYVNSKVASIFTGLKSTVLGIWEGIGGGIQSVVNGIINCINMMIGAMNGINFTVPEWIPVMGGKSFGFNIPTISNVSWFATGGIIKGTEGGSVVGVGEAGDEAIVPLSNKSRMKPFAVAVADLMPDKDQPQAVESAGVNIQVEKLVVREEADIKKIAEQLYKLQQREKRAKGVS